MKVLLRHGPLDMDKIKFLSRKTKIVCIFCIQLHGSHLLNMTVKDLLIKTYILCIHSIYTCMYT